MITLASSIGRDTGTEPNKEAIVFFKIQNFVKV